MDKRSLEHVAKRFRDSETRTEILRRELAEAIRQADKDGLPQKEICEVTGYTRQQVRRIVLSKDREEGNAGPS
ncbi:helix-turn-helix domain-containing protein [Nonomuraea polychroma]|uniref:helix-turn-helix domain-containing protein n=1 Tax=Nonomuraea polychroma TaxID=46176 RepID=UPI003D902ABB